MSQLNGLWKYPPYIPKTRNVSRHNHPQQSTSNAKNETKTTKVSHVNHSQSFSVCLRISVSGTCLRLCSRDISLDSFNHSTILLSTQLNHWMHKLLSSLQAIYIETESTVVQYPCTSRNIFHHPILRLYWKLMNGSSYFIDLMDSLLFSKLPRETMIEITLRNELADSTSVILPRKASFFSSYLHNISIAEAATPSGAPHDETFKSAG